MLEPKAEIDSCFWQLAKAETDSEAKPLKQHHNIGAFLFPLLSSSLSFFHTALQLFFSFFFLVPFFLSFFFLYREVFIFFFLSQTRFLFIFI